MYHNTTLEIGESLERSAISANAQETKILTLFRAMPNVVLTPFEVLSLLQINAPITSIRRAITDLTKEGYLERTSIKRTGKFGKANFTWRLRAAENR